MIAHLCNAHLLVRSLWTSGWALGCTQCVFRHIISLCTLLRQTTCCFLWIHSPSDMPVSWLGSDKSSHSQSKNVPTKMIFPQTQHDCSAESLAVRQSSLLHPFPFFLLTVILCIIGAYKKSSLGQIVLCTNASQSAASILKISASELQTYKKRGKSDHPHVTEIIVPK